MSTFTSVSKCRRCTKLTALLASTDHFYWKTLTRLLVVLRSLQIKKGHPSFRCPFCLIYNEKLAHYNQEHMTLYFFISLIKQESTKAGSGHESISKTPKYVSRNLATKPPPIVSAPLRLPAFIRSTFSRTGCFT